MTFTQLNLQPSILHALGKMGYDNMTPIQEAAIPLIMGGHDVVGLAETGSGKTGACGIPLVGLLTGLFGPALSGASATPAFRRTPRPPDAG